MGLGQPIRCLPSALLILAASMKAFPDNPQMAKVESDDRINELFDEVTTLLDRIHILH